MLNKKIRKTDIPCECGAKELEIETDFAGYMGDKPCYEDYGKCPECRKTLYNQDIDKRFKSQE